MMNPAKFGWISLFLFIIGLVGWWLNPGYIYEMDWFLFLWFAMVMPVWFFCGYAWTEGHLGGYPLITPYSHSATFTGEPAMTIPATAGYPTMLAYPKGGGNAFGFPFPGGKKNGWLVVPRTQALKFGKSTSCNTFTREVRPDQLPRHIYKALRNDKRWTDNCMVEIGEQPWMKDIQGGFFDLQAAADYKGIFDQQNTEITRLENKVESLMQQIESDSKIIRDISSALNTVPNEHLQERVKRAVGGEDARER